MPTRLVHVFAHNLMVDVNLDILVWAKAPVVHAGLESGIGAYYHFGRSCLKDKVLD